MVRLQSQQMLDQIQGDEPAFDRIAATNVRTIPKDSSSDEDPCESMHTQNDDYVKIKTMEYSDHHLNENSSIHDSNMLEGKIKFFFFAKKCQIFFKIT